MDNKIIVENDKKKKKNPIPTTLDFNKKCRDRAIYGPPDGKEPCGGGGEHRRRGNGVYKIVNCEKRDTLN